MTRLTCKVKAADVLEQMGAIDGIHFRTEAHPPRAQLLMHVVQRVSHYVNGVNDKLHLPFLLVVGVFSYPLLICGAQTPAYQIDSFLQIFYSSKEPNE